MPNFVVWPNSDTFPYIVFNLRSPDANSAMQKLLVRQAVNYGLDKAAAVKAIGGPDVASVINTVIPPGNTGYVDCNLYRTGSRTATGHVQIRPEQGPGIGTGLR